MPLINNTNWYHLCYLFINDVCEDKYNGLSHVAEHTLLIPTDIGVQFIARGYTCMSHVCLYFGSKALENLQEVDRKIMCGEIITDESVSCAKDQVTQEIMRLCDKTARYEKLVSFVTENRIQRLAMGDPLEVANIQTEDIVRWFEEKKHHGQLYHFLFSDAHNMIMSTPIPNICTLQGAGEAIHENCTADDSFLYTVLPCDAKTVQIYFQICSLYSKVDAIKKALYEFCIQRKVQDSLGIELTISDNFFATDERYIVVEFPWNNGSRVKDIIKMMRTEVNSISLMEYHLYLKEFMDFISLVMNQKDSNSEVMNSVKNTIIYSKPQITQADVNCIKDVDLGLFPKEWITKMPLKIVVS